MKKLKTSTAVALIRVICGLAAALFIIGSLIILPVKWGIAFTLFAIISLALIMQSTERYS